MIRKFLLWGWLVCGLQWTARAQCNNPMPKISVEQIFCAIDGKTIADLDTNNESVIWYYEEEGGAQYNDMFVLKTGIYYASNVSGGGCSPRLPVEVKVFGALPKTSIISNICKNFGATVSFLSVQGAAGSTIEWYDSEFGGTLLAGSTMLEEGVEYWAQQIDHGCISARSKTLVAFVDPSPPTINDPQQIFCDAQLSTVANLDAEVGQAGNFIIWYESETGNVPLDPTDPLIDNKLYWAAQYENGCESVARTSTTVLIDKAQYAGTNSAFEVCEIDLETFNMFDKLDGSPDINGIWSGPSKLTGDYLGTFNPAVNVGGIYTYTVSSQYGVCADDEATVTVIINKTNAPTIANTTQTFCEIEQATIANLVATGDQIQWYADATSNVVLDPSELLVNGEDYYATQTLSTTNCESVGRTKVAVSINITPAPSVAQSTQYFCEIEGATIGDLAVTGDNIQWYEDVNSATALSSTTLLQDGKSYFASQTDLTTHCESALRTEVQVVINVTNAPIVTNTIQTFCEIEQATIANLVAAGDQIQWYTDENSAIALSSTVLLEDGKSYFATQTDLSTHCESVLRTKVTVVINVTDAPIVADTTQTFCEIEQATIADLVATGDQIQWYADVNSTVALASTELLEDGKSYFATQSSSTTFCESLVRTEVKVVMQVTNAPIVTNTTQTFCEIEQATIADLVATGGGIQWYSDINSTLVLDATEPLVNGKSYFATKIDPITNCESVSRTGVTVVVNVTSAPTVTHTTQTFCEIEQATIADLDVTGNDIKWYADATSTVALDPTAPLVNGASYFATQSDDVNNCQSVSRTEVMVVIKVTNAPTVVNTTQAFCEIDQATISDLAVSGDQIQWYADATSIVALDPTEPLVNGKSYFATQSNPGGYCESASRTEVKVVINVTSAPTVSNTTQTFCEIEVATISDLVASGDQVQWYADANSTVALASIEPLVDGASYFASQSDTNCESTSRTEVKVVINVTNAPTVINTTQTFCEIAQATIANLDVTGNDIKWYADETSTVPLDVTELIVDGEDYFASETNETTLCESVTRVKVVAIISETPKAPVVINDEQSFCESSFAVLSDLEIQGEDIKWYADETSPVELDSNELLANNTSYFASQTSSLTGCESLDRTEVRVELFPVGIPVLEQGGDAFCSIDNPTLLLLNNKVSVESGAVVVWYDSPTGENMLDLDELLVHDQSYYAVAIGVNGCESIDALEIVVNLEACEEDRIKFFDGFSPNNDGVNDTFKVLNIDYFYPDYELEYFNRWGSSIYKEDATKPSWNGRLNGDGELMPVGVYYYVLKFNKNNKKPKQGRLYLGR